jgi:hypothetical protein
MPAKFIFLAFAKAFQAFGIGDRTLRNKESEGLPPSYPGSHFEQRLACDTVN